MEERVRCYRISLPGDEPSDWIWRSGIEPTIEDVRRLLCNQREGTTIEVKITEVFPSVLEKLRGGDA